MPDLLLHPLINAAGFVLCSLLLLWRLEALIARGWEGTFLGSLIMPYCSGLGNLIFVAIVLKSGAPSGEIFVNATVNNITNLTLLLGLPAVFGWLSLRPQGETGKRRYRGSQKEQRLFSVTRLELLFSLSAAAFFTAMVWVLGRDGRLDFTDGLVLIALFLFWQSFHCYEAFKTNLRQNRAGNPLIIADAFLLLLAAAGMVFTIDHLVDALLGMEEGWFRADRLGWITGILMILPNAMLALYYGMRRRPDIVLASQIGDGHICIPLCLGVYAIFNPVLLPTDFSLTLGLLGGVIAMIALLLIAAGRIPKWCGGLLIGVFGVFAWIGLL
ncbi:MAG: sodium:calcium symporter [Opitutales bacterium]|nr:sodium:calcium symporter [Opitutales bacterium]